MKSVNLKSTRRLTAIVVTLALVFSFIAGIRPTTVSAAELPTNDEYSLEDANVQTFEFEVTPYDTPDATDVETYYFINDKQFSFYETNIGKSFYVKQGCEARMVIAVVASDKSSDDYIRVSVELNNPSVYYPINLGKIPTNVATLKVFHIHAGENYLKYEGGRSGVTYTVRVSLYTWDY